MTLDNSTLVRLALLSSCIGGAAWPACLHHVGLRVDHLPTDFCSAERIGRLGRDKVAVGKCVDGGVEVRRNVASDAVKRLSLLCRSDRLGSLAIIVGRCGSARANACPAGGTSVV